MKILEEKMRIKINFGSGGIWTHASEETGALNQRLRPLGHATLLYEMIKNKQKLQQTKVS